MLLFEMPEDILCASKPLVTQRAVLQTMTAMPCTKGPRKGPPVRGLSQGNNLLVMYQRLRAGLREQSGF